MSSVFVNGTFDILHPGHIYLLEYAKSLGDKLFVAIDSDTRVQRLKGLDRPIYSLHDRMTMLRSLKAVDEVIAFSYDEELELIVKQIRPDVMVVGSDYKNRKVIGSEYAKQLIFFERWECWSTTQTIQRIVAG